MTYMYDLRPMPCTKSCVSDHCTRCHALIITTAQDAMYILIIKCMDHLLICELITMATFLILSSANEQLQ